MVSGAREMLRSSWNFCRLPQAGGGGGAVGLEHRVRLQLGVRESFLPSKLSRAGAARRELPVQGVLGALNGQLHVEGDANDLQYCGGGRGGVGWTLGSAGPLLFRDVASNREQCSQEAAGTTTDYKLLCDFSSVTKATAG